MTGGNGGANPGRGRVRLLVTLDLPEMVRRQAEAWQQEALTDPALRHNTGLRIVLMFLGHRPQREVGRYLEAIRELCASAPAPLVEVLVEANVLTALATAEAVKTKLLVVEGLKQRIDKTELENSLRDYIAEHPWLLGPEWETYKKETSPTNLLKDARKQAGLDDPESWPGRLDLALIAGKTLLIVEFMRPGITIDTDHLQRWENYVRIVKTELAGNSGLGFESVQGIIVADKLAKKAHVTDKIKSLNNEGMRALDWPNLLARAGAEWKEYFALLVGRGPDDERLRKLAEEIGIDIPKPVNEAAGAAQ
jgi:hypothetical protein